MAVKMEGSEADSSEGVPKRSPGSESGAASRVMSNMPSIPVLSSTGLFRKLARVFATLSSVSPFHVR
jgi:hypothetical protein